jgi:hypothetical protein
MQKRARTPSEAAAAVQAAKAVLAEALRGSRALTAGSWSTRKQGQLYRLNRATIGLLRALDAERETPRSPD